MIKPILLAFGAFFIGVFGAQQALAQACDVVPEAIVKLREPISGAYNVWDTVHGEIPTQEIFKSGMVLEGGNLLVAGERRANADDREAKLLISEIGRNGRVLWEKDLDVSGLHRVVKVLPYDKGGVILAEIKPAKGVSYAWIGFINTAGDLLSKRMIKGGRTALTPKDISLSASGKGFILSTYAEREGSEQPGWSQLYRLNSKGQVISDHAFVIGAENAMNQIMLAENGDVIGVGHIRDDRGLKTGWIMRMDDGLRMIWQKSYPRGAGADFVRAHPLTKGYITLVGTALPAFEGNRAAWLITVDETSGDVAWQRYFTGSLHFDGRDVMVNEDALISVLIDGEQPADSDVTEHVRLFTINPRGVMFTNHEFFNGAAVDAFTLLPSKGVERLIIGTTRIAHQIEDLETEETDKGEGEADKVEVMEGGANGDDEAPEIVMSYEGWALAAVGVDPYPYDDPCKPKARALQ